MIKLCGKVYQSYRQAAKIYGLDKHTLIRHVQKYGPNDDRIFNTRRYKTPIYLYDHMFSNLDEAAAYLGITKNGLRRRINKYGQNSPRVLAKNPNSLVIICNKAYNSKREAALMHHISPKTFYGRLKRLGYHNPKVFEKVQVHQK